MDDVERACCERQRKGRSSTEEMQRKMQRKCRGKAEKSHEEM
jgi:hypothetical protein